MLAWSGGAGVALAKRRQRTGTGGSKAEIAAGERVAHADVMVQIGQRRHAGNVRFRAFDDHRQPEPQLAKPDGHRIAIDPEDGVREQLSAYAMGVDDRGCLPQLRASVHGAEAFEGVHQKRPRAAGRVEDAQAVQRNGGGRGEHERRAVVVESIGRQLGEGGEEGIAHDLIDERRRRVERA